MKRDGSAERRLGARFSGTCRTRMRARSGAVHVWSPGAYHQAGFGTPSATRIVSAGMTRADVAKALSVILLCGLFAGCATHWNTRPTGICLPVPASVVQIGQNTPQGLSGNSFPVSASVPKGDYIWVSVGLPIAENSFPTTTSSSLRRVCTQVLANGSRSLFLAKRTGSAQVVSEPRPERTAMLGASATIVVTAAPG
jgi:hypothetical protein